MEGLLSRELFSEIIDYVFNNYEWSEKLDDEVDRITLEYRNKGKIGRNKATVKSSLYSLCVRRVARTVYEGFDSLASYYQ